MEEEQGSDAAQGEVSGGAGVEHGSASRGGQGHDKRVKRAIRLHLEYGAEVLSSHHDFVWKEAEKLARKIGLRVL